MNAPERVYLLADMHLKPLDAPTEAARRQAVVGNERLARFLAGIDGKAGGLILLGDAFNFWFERRGHVVGDYFASLSLFKEAADRGLEIHHISGNRDFAVGGGLGFDPATRFPGFLNLQRGFTVSRLADFGIEPHGPKWRFYQNGKTICCVHGDGLCRGDYKFMLLRWLLQGPVGRTLLRYSPWPLADYVFSRQQGRVTIRPSKKQPEELFDEAAVWRELAMGADLLLCGHIHAQYEREVDVAGRKCRMLALPSWMDGGYGVLENGTARVERFEAE